MRRDITSDSVKHTYNHSSPHHSCIERDSHQDRTRLTAVTKGYPFDDTADHLSEYDDGGKGDRDIVEEKSDSTDDRFADLQLSSHEALRSANRMKCPGKCGKQRRYYCSECIIPLLGSSSEMPKVTLPVHVHILQAASESPQQSTAQHVPLLAPSSATVWRPYPECMLDFQTAVLDKAEADTIAILYVVQSRMLLHLLYSVFLLLHNALVHPLTLSQYQCLSHATNHADIQGMMQ